MSDIIRKPSSFEEYWLASKAWEREGSGEPWVRADNPGAIAFYAACGFVRDAEQGTQMLLTVPT